MTTAAIHRSTRLVGYVYALGAGCLWGTTGPLSTALYAQGETLTGIGLWRLVLGLLMVVGGVAGGYLEEAHPNTRS